MDSGYYYRVKEQNEALRRKGYRNEDASLSTERRPRATSQHHGQGHELEEEEGGVNYIDVPEPYIFAVDMAELRYDGNWDANMARLASEIRSLRCKRLVLDVFDSQLSPRPNRHDKDSGGTVDSSGNGDSEHSEVVGEVFSGGPADLTAWAHDSANSWTAKAGSDVSNSSATSAIKKYLYVPLSFGAGGGLKLHSMNSPQSNLDHSDDLILCRQFMKPTLGNRSCFSICK